MKKLIIFIFIFLSLLNLYSDNSNDTVIQITDTDISIKKNKTNHLFYFDFSSSLGGSIVYNNNYQTQYYNSIILSYGGAFGLNIAFQYILNNYFAIGASLTGILSIVNSEVANYPKSDEIAYYKYSYISGSYSGGAACLSFAAGDLVKKNVGFLIEIGGGWLGCIKLGFFIKNFLFKTSYYLTYGNFNALAHTITLEFGYKIKVKINKV